jgi:alpha-glucosidase
MLVLTLKGTPFLFAGDELGMEQVPIPEDRITDPFEKLVPGHGLNRDPERSPMRWNAGRNGGFSEGEPWLPMGGDVALRNIETLQSDPHSMLWLYRRLIQLRRHEPALLEGDYEPVRSLNDIVVYKRNQGGNSVLVALNTKHEPRKLEWGGEGMLLLSSNLDHERQRVRGPLLLRPDEGIIVKLET